MDVITRLQDYRSLCLGGPKSFLVKTDFNALKCWRALQEPKRKTNQSPQGS